MTEATTASGTMPDYASVKSRLLNMFWFIFLNTFEFIFRIYQRMMGDNLTFLVERKDVWVPKNATCIVTGANVGLGKETARHLARVGYNVIMACRSVKKGQEARDEIITAEPKLTDRLEVWEVDFNSLASVRALATKFIDSGRPLHLLVNNAGLINTKWAVTADSMEQTFQVNHVSPFYLTNLLLPRLLEAKKPRVVNLSSVAHYAGHIDFDDLMTKKKSFMDLPVYGQSKLANILFTKELIKQTEGKITCYAVHPGVVASEFYRTSWAQFFTNLFAKSPNEGARCQVYACLVPEGEVPNGSYLWQCSVWGTSQEAADPEVASRLWEETWRLVRESKVES